MLRGFRMISSASISHRDDGRLWALALGISVVLNVGLLGVVGLMMLKTKTFQQNVPKAEPVPEETVVVIPMEMLEPVVEPAVENPEKSFARTSEDQRAAEAPEDPAFVGERDTLATSDRAPDADAPALPSQAGEKPLSESDFETTESDYQDGRMAESEAPPTEVVAEPSPMVPEVPPQPEQTAAKGEEIEDPEKSEELSVPPQRERLMEGPQPYDVPVPMEERKVEEDPKPKPAERPEKGNSEEMPPKEEVDESPKPASAPPDDPAFRGFQRKAAIRGSISRTGRSALDVADTPEGRYQAMISRAVEQEWQRNCARHRDFITPGYLTVRFFVEASGKVKSVQFVGEMETGQVQKGFTLSSIRDAAIPAMPAELRKELDGEPMELLFNFYF